MGTISFYVCTPNAIDKSTIVVKDKNNGMQVIYSGTLAKGTCSDAITATSNNADEAYIEYTVNGQNPKEHAYIKDGENVEVY